MDDYRIVFYGGGFKASNVCEIDPTQVIYARVTESIYDIGTLELSTTQYVPYLARMTVFDTRRNRYVGEYVLTESSSTSTASSVVYKYTAIASVYYDLSLETVAGGQINRDNTRAVFDMLYNNIYHSSVWVPLATSLSQNDIYCPYTDFVSEMTLWDTLQFIMGNLDCDSAQIIATWIQPKIYAYNGPGPHRRVGIEIALSTQQPTRTVDIASNAQSIVREISYTGVCERSRILYSGSLDGGPSRLFHLESLTSSDPWLTAYISPKFGTKSYYMDNSGQMSSYQKTNIFKETDMKPEDVAGSYSNKKRLESAAKTELLRNSDYPVEYKVVLNNDEDFNIGDVVILKTNVPPIYYALPTTYEAVTVLCSGYKLDLCTGYKQYTFGTSAVTRTPKIETRRSS